MEKQAKQLVEISGLQNQALKDATVKYIVKDKLITRPIPKLITLLSHPCSVEQIDNINSEFDRSYNNLDDSDTDPGTGKPLRQVLIDMKAHNASRIIGLGFDVAFKDNLKVNSETGAVVVNRDAMGQPDPRFTKCAAAEVSIEMPKPAEEKIGPKTVYTDPNSFKEFLQKQSDPYKGSQQGVGRTRKRKHKSKKTLRGRKVRRNVH